ncbi:retrovirus-related pol polyprotein from transposon TNT 1-94 [Tanacetum coccineum]
MNHTMTQNQNLQNEVVRLKANNESLKYEVIKLKKTIEKWTCSIVTLDQLLSEQVPGNIVHALGGKGKKGNKPAKVMFVKSEASSSQEAISDSESETEIQEPLPPLPKLTGAEPTVAPNTESSNEEHTATEKLLLTLMKEVKSLKEQIKPSAESSSESEVGGSTSGKLKTKTMFKPCIHCGLKNRLSKNCFKKPKPSKAVDHLINGNLTVQRSLTKLKSQAYIVTAIKKSVTMPTPFIPCNYCRFNDHHSDECEYYRGCEIYGSIAHEPKDCNRRGMILRRPRIASQQSKEPTEKSVYQDSRNHFNQDNEVVLIALRRRDVYVIDISSYPEGSNTCFFAKASSFEKWLWHKRLSHLNFKNINDLAKQNLVSGLPSLIFSRNKHLEPSMKLS